MLVTEKMAPDSTTTYIVDANRLLGVAIGEAIVLPIHQRRATIAPVTDTLSVNPDAHADIMREEVTGPYNPSFGSADTGVAA